MSKIPANVEPIWMKSDGRCWYCGTQLYFSKPPPEPWVARKFVPDHYLPVSLGGARGLENIVPCCVICALRKAGRSVEQFRMLESWRVAGAPKFNLVQIEWLFDMAVDFLRIPIPVIFWFEVEGLLPDGTDLRENEKAQA